MVEFADSNNIIINRNINGDKIDIKLKNYEDSKIKKIYVNDYINIKINNSYDRDFAFISGQIYSPGNYVINDSTKIKDLIALAGGYKKSANINSITINNKNIAELLDREYVRINSILPQNRSASQISYLKSRIYSKKGLIISNNQSVTNNILNYIINSNDQIYIPRLINNIEIIGAINTPGYYEYKTTYKLIDYIKNSGGLTNLSSGRYYLIDESGEKTKINSKYSNLSPGDILFIEEDQDSNSWFKFKEIMSVLGQIATLVAVIQSANN